MNDFFNMTQTVQLFICGRLIINFSLKMDRFFKMTQAVPSSIYGRFIETFSLEWITFQHDANLPKPFTFWICSWMTGWLKGDWEEHEKCLWVFSTFEFLHFFQIWWSLEKRKYGFLLTRGKIIVFLIIKTWRTYITRKSILHESTISRAIENTIISEIW